MRYKLSMCQGLLTPDDLPLKRSLKSQMDQDHSIDSTSPAQDLFSTPSSSSSTSCFADEIVASMLTPGLINSSVIFVIHFSLLLLSITFVALYFMSSSLHCLVLLFITSCLWASVTWFLGELQQDDSSSENENDLKKIYFSNLKNSKEE